MTSADCVFFHCNVCDHTGHPCHELCQSSLRPINGLEYRDHFELYEKRRNQREDMRLKWLALIVSMVAMIVSLAGVVWQVSQRQPRQVIVRIVEKPPEQTATADPLGPALPAPAADKGSPPRSH